MKSLVKLLTISIVSSFVLLVGISGPARAADKEITVGYQLMQNPWKVAIADKAFEKATGYTINWRRFDSGGKVITAMASGDVDIASAGSSPIAAAVSRGVDIQLVYVLENIASAEALVVRNGTGIHNPKDLVGKTIATPFVSTSHFDTVKALQMWGINPGKVRLLNMQPPQIVAAWKRGDIDGAYVWDPALSTIKKDGKTLITSGQVCARSKGNCTFDGLVVRRAFAQKHPQFMAEFIKVIDTATQNYKHNSGQWTANSPQVEKIARMSGSDASQVPDALKLYGFLSLQQEASCTWLGCGSKGGASFSLKAQSQFLKSQGDLDSVQDDYSRYVTAKYVKAAERLN